MKTIITFLSILCFISVSSQTSQDYSIIRVKLQELRTLYNAKIKLYNDEKEKLEDSNNIANLDYDTNAQKKIVNKLYDDLVSICSQQSILKVAFKDKIDDNDMESDFPDNLCKDFKEKTRQIPTSYTSDNLTYLNAYNFDFNNSNTSSGYMGNLNLFFKLNKKDVESKWAINAGLKKTNYAFTNNNYATYVEENLLINPLDQLSEVGDKYYTEYNKYSTTSKISSWSAYFQLMYKVIKNFKNIYAHAHTELQISNVDYNIEKTNIQRVINSITTTENIPNLTPKLEDNASIHNTYFGYYLGGGLTGDFIIIDQENYKLRYFIQETIGFSNVQSGNSKSTFTDNNYFNNNVNYTGNFDSSKHFFHLLNTYISNKINGLDIIVGTEIRGVFDSPPLYIFYVGINTDLQKIGDLFR